MAGKDLAGASVNARFDREPGGKAGGVRLRDRGLQPECVETGDAKQRRAGRHGFTLAHQHLADHAIVRGEQRQRAGTAGVAGQPERAQALARGIPQRTRGRGLRRIQRACFSRGAAPLRRAHQREALAPAHGGKRRAHVHPFHKPFHPRRDHRFMPQVPGQRAGNRDVRFQAAGLHLAGADAQVLLHARIDSHLCLRRLVGVARHEIHVHERRLSGFVEALVRHHRVVPVEHLAMCRSGRFAAGVLGMARVEAGVPGNPEAESDEQHDGRDKEEESRMESQVHGVDTSSGNSQASAAQVRPSSP